MRSLYLDYSSNVVEHTYTMWKAYLFGASVSDVKCMFTSAFSDTVYCTEFIWGIYTDIVVSYVPMK